MKALISILLASSLYAGNMFVTAGISMGADTTGTTDSEIAESPFGTFGVEYETKYGNLFYEHTSSIPQIDETMGLNMIGYKYGYSFKNVNPYAGVSFRDVAFDGDYYRDRIGGTIGIVGIEKDFGYSSLYLEYKGSLDEGKNLTTFGFRLKFDSEDF
jgi:hypothetical protein